MRRYELTDEEWARIEQLLPGKAGDPGRHGEDNRQFVNGVIWIARSGAPWRDLPERYGEWNSVFQRFNRWSKAGVWKRVFEALKHPDLEAILLDSTIVRAHQHSAGASKKRGTKETKQSAAHVEA
jgi:putative transposase